MNRRLPLRHLLLTALRLRTAAMKIVSPSVTAPVLMLLLLTQKAEAVVFYYTYGKDNGGLARMAIDEQSGKWLGHQAISGPPMQEPKKLVVTQDGGHAVVTSEESNTVWCYQLGSEPKLIQALKLDDSTSEVSLINDRAILAASGGFFYQIDPTRGKVEKTWNSRESLSPSGRKGEDILYLPEKQLALISFQKDSKKGKHLGSRMLVFNPQRFEVVHDLPLPRDHPELHIAADQREQGPNPEIMFVAPKSNTIALTLDLYGALAFADLDAALRGEWKNLEYKPTALDGTWGTAFPDRGLFFESAGLEQLLISNASTNGGLVLVDLASRQITQSFPCTAGTEMPVWLTAHKKIVTVVSGKVKARTREGLSNEITGMQNELLVFDLAPQETGGKVTLERIPFEGALTRVEPLSIGAVQNELLLLLQGAEGYQEWLVYDLNSKRILHKEAAKGSVSRIEAWRPEQ